MIIGLKYNDTQYYYIKNAQNDIVGLLDTNLNQVVSYEYDSWGNILSIKDASGNQITSNTHIGIINPYRYRSYRYDTETNLYYLQSRYYSSEWGRFVNFDNYGGEVGSLISHNGYAYGNNNPVNNVDMNGNFAISIGAALFAAMTALVATIATVTAIIVTSVVADKITEKEKRDNEKNHTVYKLIERDNNVKYVGRTTNYKDRMKQHSKDPQKENLISEIVAKDLSKSEARGLEQILIIQYATKKELGGLNKINGISPNNMKLGQYMKSGLNIAITYLGNMAEDEALYWMYEKWR